MKRRNFSIMQTATIDTTQISKSDIQNLSITFLTAVKKFYEDPVNLKKFEAWKESRKED
jgi:hypothetical protein